MQRLSRALLSRISVRSLTNATSNQQVQNRLKEIVNENKIVVFMKGTPEQPMCGFSRAVCQILDIHEVDKQFISSHDVLEEDSIREGVKEFSGWPTIPQVYMGGEFVGGCDIMLELHKSGELIDELKKLDIKSALDDS